MRVGTVPEGATDVRIAPQLSKKGKGKAKDGEGGELSPQDVSLHLIPNAAEKSLEELIAEYGSALRIAVDPDKSFVAITGSHIRVYALFFLSRTALMLCLAFQAYADGLHLLAADRSRQRERHERRRPKQEDRLRCEDLSLLGGETARLEPHVCAHPLRQRQS